MSEIPAGWGVLGCAGGLLFGLFGGSLLLILLSLSQAASRPLPPASNPSNGPDLRVTITEDLLNQVIQDSLEEPAQVDILPDQQVSVEINTEFSAFGAVVPVRITGLFGLQLSGQSLELQLLDTQVFGLNLPSELTDFFSTNLPTINQDINRSLQEIAATLGVPLTFTDLRTDETTLWLEAREIR